MATRADEDVKKVTITYTREVNLVDKTCVVCGNTFTGVKKSKYCSNACKQRANYEKNGAAYRQARVEKYRKEKGSQGREDGAKN